MMSKSWWILLASLLVFQCHPHRQRSPHEIAPLPKTTPIGRPPAPALTVQEKAAFPPSPAPDFRSSGKRFLDCSHYKLDEEGRGPLERKFGFERLHSISSGKAYDVYRARDRGEGAAAEKRLRERRMPLKERIEELARTTPSPFFWDFEGSEWNQNPERWAEIIRWARAVAPDKKQGHYAVFPVRLFWETPEEIDAMNRERLGIIPEVDFFVPTFYRFYSKEHDKRGSWKYMVLQAELAVKRYGQGKPVYPMMMEYYHPRAPEKYARQEIPEAELEEMFRFVLDRFDGLCLWGGRNSPGSIQTAYRRRGFDTAGAVDWDAANMDESPLGRVLSRVVPEYSGAGPRLAPKAD